MQPTVNHSADNTTVTWPTIKIGVNAENIREAPYGLLADVLVASTVSPETVHGPLRIGMMSQRDIRELTVDCQKRFGDLCDWSAIIPRSISLIVATYRAGNAPVVLADVPDPGEPQYLVPGFLLEDRNVFLSAYGGSAKSIIGMALAISVATGEPFAGMRPAKIGPALFLDWEDEADTQSYRMRAICAGYGLKEPPTNLYHWAMTTPLKEAQRAIRRFVRAHNVELVIIDSIGAAIGGELVKEDAAIQAMLACKGMSPVSRLIIAHVSKADADKASSERRTYGSGFFEFGARDVWQAHRAGDPGGNEITVAFTNTKNNHGQKEPFGLTIRFAPGTITLNRCDITCEPDLIAGLSQPDLICYVLKSDGEQTAKELSENTGLRPEILKANLFRLRKQERILRLPSNNGRQDVYSLNWTHPKNLEN